MAAADGFSVCPAILVESIQCEVIIDQRSGMPPARSLASISRVKQQFPQLFLSVAGSKMGRRMRRNKAPCSRTPLLYCRQAKSRHPPLSCAKSTQYGPDFTIW